MARGQGGKDQYLIHWFGGASFVVKVLKTKLIVYTSKEDVKKHYYVPGKKVYETHFKQIYIPTGFGPGGVGSPVVGDETGNSILARIDDSGKHVYVGHDVLEFNVHENIEGYYSEVSPFQNSFDTPRGYIVTKEHIYIINHDRIYPRSIFHKSLIDVLERDEESLRPKGYSAALKAKMKKTGVPIGAKIIVPFSGN
jgi:hypothetical protein